MSALTSFVLIAQDRPYGHPRSYLLFLIDATQNSQEAVTDSHISHIPFRLSYPFSIPVLFSNFLFLVVENTSLALFYILSVVAFLPTLSVLRSLVVAPDLLFLPLFFFFFSLLEISFLKRNYATVMAWGL